MIYSVNALNNMKMCEFIEKKHFIKKYIFKNIKNENFFQ